jgi:hypothetical protein
MTQSEWLESSDPAKMLAYLRSSGSESERKLRLFASACCQRMWHLLLEDPGKLLSPNRWQKRGKWQEKWGPYFAEALRQLWDNRSHVVRTLEEYVKSQEDYAGGFVSQRDLAGRAIALARIAWSDAEWLDNCVAELNEGASAAEALRSCAVMFSSAASSESTPGDVITYAGAAVLFASADAYADVAKDVREGHARYATQVEHHAQTAQRTEDLDAIWEVNLGAPLNPARQAAIDACRAIDLACGQAARAAGAAERQTQADLLRELFGPMPFRHLSDARASVGPRAATLAGAIYQDIPSPKENRLIGYTGGR